MSFYENIVLKLAQQGVVKTKEWYSWIGYPYQGDLGKIFLGDAYHLPKSLEQLRKKDPQAVILAQGVLPNNLQKTPIQIMDQLEITFYTLVEKHLYSCESILVKLLE